MGRHLKQLKHGERKGGSGKILEGNEGTRASQSRKGDKDVAFNR